METSYENIQIAVRHLPEANGGPFESIQDAIAAGYDTINPVTGFVQIGAVIEGAFITIMSEKASLVHDAIEVAKKDAAANATTTVHDTTGTPGSAQPVEQAPVEQPPVEQPPTSTTGTPGSGQLTEQPPAGPTG